MSCAAQLLTPWLPRTTQISALLHRWKPCLCGTRAKRSFRTRLNPNARKLCKCLASFILFSGRRFVKPTVLFLHVFRLQAHSLFLHLCRLALSWLSKRLPFVFQVIVIAHSRISYLRVKAELTQAQKEVKVMRRERLRLLLESEHEGYINELQERGMAIVAEDFWATN